MARPVSTSAEEVPTGPCWSLGETETGMISCHGNDPGRRRALLSNGTLNRSRMGVEKSNVHGVGEGNAFTMAGLSCWSEWKPQIGRPEGLYALWRGSQDEPGNLVHGQSPRDDRPPVPPLLYSSGYSRSWGLASITIGLSSEISPSTSGVSGTLGDWRQTMEDPSNQVRSTWRRS
jgi:hypothetical protein